MLSKSWDKKAYELAPTTARRARTLSRKFHFPGVKAMADSIPEGGAVLDVGSGLSNLGKVIAGLRSDISWTNADLMYDHRSIVTRARFNAPPNLGLVAVNATELVEEFGRAKFDRVFSWWMMPHINMESMLEAEDAAMNMLLVTKPDGVLAVGPDLSFGSKQEAFVTHVPDSEEYFAHTASEIADRTRLPISKSVYQELYNEIAHFHRRLGL